MPTTLHAAAEAYLRARHLSPGTQAEYRSTLRKWNRWGGAIPIEAMSRKNLREFLDWVFEQAVREDGDNPGRTANKARENLRAIVSWAWEHDLIQDFPRFPKPKPQRDVAGLHYLTKSELNALYFATHRLRNPPGWTESFPLGKYWRCALVVFFNYGVDTGTIWKTAPIHEPILWRHVSWNQQCPGGRAQARSRWGWLFYRRVKTKKTFYRPMNRPMNRAVHSHIRSIMPEDRQPDSPVFPGGGSRPNRRFQQLCTFAGIKPKLDVETGEEKLWQLKDLRKTCATYYDAHVPESSVEILGHTVGGVTYRHYAHRDPLAFKAIITIPQPSAFNALVRGYDGECPCCRRPFTPGR